MSPEFIATSRESSAGRTLELEAGRYIFREGELGTEMYIVHEGTVEILQEHPNGARQLAKLGKGDFFGEMSILEELPRNASARALTPVTLIVIDGATFDSMLRGNPEIAVRIMRKLSRRVREADDLVRQALRGEEPEGVDETAEPARREPTVAHLIHVESGVSFDLPAAGPTTIGRRDPVTGIEPEVDLTAIDPERSSSRRHAKIVRQGEQFLVVEDIGATNGTFVDGTRIRTGVPAEIRSGSTVRFGLVELQFQLA